VGIIELKKSCCCGETGRTCVTTIPCCVTLHLSAPCSLISKEVHNMRTASFYTAQRRTVTVRLHIIKENKKTKIYVRSSTKSDWVSDWVSEWERAGIVIGREPLGNQQHSRPRVRVVVCVCCVQPAQTFPFFPVHFYKVFYFPLDDFPLKFERNKSNVLLRLVRSYFFLLLFFYFIRGNRII
jgi:hypothetical protein